MLVALTWTVLLLRIVAFERPSKRARAEWSSRRSGFLIVLVAGLLFGFCSVFRTVNTASVLPTQRLRGMKEPVVLLTNLHDRALYRSGAPFDDSRKNNGRSYSQL